MALNSDVAPIIIKKVKKVAHAAHHGGAWKVAYADFVTAMMAFFLLLWLLNATTEVQKQGISDYFSPSSVSKSTGGAGGMLGGRTISTPGAMTSRTAVPSVSLSLEPTSGATRGDAEEEGGANDKTETAENAIREAEKAVLARAEEQREAENARFDAAEQRLRQAIEGSPDLKEFADSILVDRTPEGLRIQIVDKEGRPMFASGNANMPDRTRKLIAQVAATILPLPNRIKVTGHTDSVPFRGAKRGHGNWELSSDRAQATRRVLDEAGLSADRIASVAGRAAQDPLLPEDPTSARNRRISIVLLRQPAPEPEPEPEPRPAAAAPASGGNAAAPAAAPAGAPATQTLQRDWSGPRVR
jgi:chemotaxis protein MotB